MFRLHIARYFGFALALYALFGAGSLNATIIHVPADQPTIQAGIDAAIPGDTVLVADGTYTGPGNWIVDFLGKSVMLVSENGPVSTIIEILGNLTTPARGWRLTSGEDSTTVIDGFTIVGGWPSAISFSSSSATLKNCIFRQSRATGGQGAIKCDDANLVITNCSLDSNFSEYGGGAIRCINSNMMISNCSFSFNEAGGGHGPNPAPGSGGALYAANSDVTLDDCIFDNNRSRDLYIVRFDPFGVDSTPGFGGALYASGGSLRIGNCTFVQNFASKGSALYLKNSSPNLLNTAVCFNTGSLHLDLRGMPIWCEGTSNPILTCCDAYGNEGGDWIGCITGQANINGNFSFDPLFCDTANSNYTLDRLSPCLPQHNSCGVLIGALELGCDLGFVCADANGDSLVTQDDIAFLQTFYSQCGTAPFPLGASDVNCDNIVDIQDIIYLASYLNASGPAPCCQ